MRFKIRNKNKTLQLNGSSQYAYITAANQTGIDWGQNDFIVAGWFFVIDTGGIQHLFGKYSGASNANNSGGVGIELLYRGDLSTKQLYFRVNNGDGSSGNTIATDGSNYKNIHGKWVHIACVVDRGNSEATVYVNGINARDTNKSITDVSGSWSDTGDFVIGRQSGTGTINYMKGYVADVSVIIYGVGGLPSNLQEEIDSLYYADSKPSKTVSYWTLDNTPNDSIGTNHLTLAGNPVYSTERKFSARATI